MASIIKRAYMATLPDGRRVKRLCENYTIEYTDPATGRRKRAKGYRDKGATKQLAAKLESALARGEQGLVDPYKAHKARPLSEHVTEWLADLRAKGRDPMYVYTAEKRLARLHAACGWASLADVEPNGFMRWREKERDNRSKGAGRDGTGIGATTLNQYLETARTFLAWCRQTRRCAGNPLAEVEKVGGEKKRKRRALTDEQVGKLLAAAAPERALAYRVALATGLRRSELEALKWVDLRITATRPAIQLRAEATKARRGDRVPLPESLAVDLRAARPADVSDAAAVFPRVPSLYWWRKDLEAAGIPYADAMGRRADFHGGTRKTLCTRLHRGNVPLATAMRIMRHTDARLTLVDYTDDEQLGTDGAVLPEVPAATAGAARVPGNGSAATAAGA